MFNILRFGIANHHYKNAIEVRDSIRSMAPPITSKRNDAFIERLEYLPSIRNALYVKFKRPPTWKASVPFKDEKILLLIHGGGGYGGQQDGWQASSIAEHVYLEQFQEFSKHENVAISCSNLHTPLTHMLSVNYRLMGLEEHERKNSSHYASNLEDQIHDVLQAYLWLISENLHVNSQERSLPVFSPEQIVVMGDSFGATLAASFLLKLASDPKQYPMPSSIILISGCYDFSMKSAFETMNERNTLMCSRYVMNITKQCYDDRHTSNAWIPSSLLRNENELGDSSVLSTFRMHFEHFNSDTTNNSQQIMDLTTTRLFSTKWLMVFSKDEEVTFENELLVQLLMKNQHFNLQVMRDAMMPHIYPFFEYYFPEARNAMIRLFHWMDCDGSLRL